MSGSINVLYRYTGFVYSKSKFSTDTGQTYNYWYQYNIV